MPNIEGGRPGLRYIMERNHAAYWVTADRGYVIWVNKGGEARYLKFFVPLMNVEAAELDLAYHITPPRSVYEEIEPALNFKDHMIPPRSVCEEIIGPLTDKTDDLAPWRGEVGGFVFTAPDLGIESNARPQGASVSAPAFQRGQNTHLTIGHWAIIISSASVLFCLLIVLLLMIQRA